MTVMLTLKTKKHTVYMFEKIEEISLVAWDKFAYELWVGFIFADIAIE